MRLWLMIALIFGAILHPANAQGTCFLASRYLKSGTINTCKTGTLARTTVVIK